MSKNVPEYRVWVAMRQRCYLKTVKRFADYGGRGIAVCARWKKSFAAFIADMGRRPSPQHTIERVDNNKGYSKSNCKWATRLEQGRNKRNVLFATIGGVKKRLVEWAESSGIEAGTINSRHDRGVRGEDLIAPVDGWHERHTYNRRTNVMIEFNGKNMPIAWWAREVGIRTATLRRRLEYNWPLEQALSAEMHKGGRNKTS